MMISRSPDGGHTQGRCRGFSPPVLIAIVILTLIQGCRPNTDASGTAPARTTDAVQVTSIHSRRDIERTLINGMATNEVLARLGPCSDIVTFPDGALLWTYWLRPFREEDTNNGLYVLAARLSITNGRVEHVGYLRATEPMVGPHVLTTNSGVAKRPPDASAEPSLLTLSSVSPNRSQGTRFIDSRRFPNLGYAPINPEVNIARLRSVVIERRPITESTQEPVRRWSFIVYFTGQDSQVVDSFTRTNVSHRILISVNGELVSAPMLVAPIETGSLAFDCADPKLAERLERELTQMAREEAPRPDQWNAK